MLFSDISKLVDRNLQWPCVTWYGRGSASFLRLLTKSGLDWTGLDWNKLDWIELNQINKYGLDWARLDHVPINIAGLHIYVNNKVLKLILHVLFKVELFSLVKDHQTAFSSIVLNKMSWALHCHASDNYKNSNFEQWFRCTHLILSKAGLMLQLLFHFHILKMTFSKAGTCLLCHSFAHVVRFSFTDTSP